MPDVEIIWTVRQRRRLEDGEDPLAVGTVDVDHLLWAVEAGEVDVEVRLLE